jgi:hypothetical protein
MPDCDSDDRQDRDVTEEKTMIDEIVGTGMDGTVTTTTTISVDIEIEFKTGKADRLKWTSEIKRYLCSSTSTTRYHFEVVMLWHIRGYGLPGVWTMRGSRINCIMLNMFHWENTSSKLRSVLNVWNRCWSIMNKNSHWFAE